jgi:hypothetical protein
LKEALEKNAVMEEDLKVKMDGHQLEMRALKDEVNTVERAKDSINQEIKEQETILRNFIDTLKTRSRVIDRAQKNIVLKEKACAIIQDLMENQMRERQKRVDLAKAKVRTYTLFEINVLQIVLHLHSDCCIQTTELIQDWDGNPIKTSNSDTRAK